MKVIIGYGGLYQCVLGYHRPQFTIIGEQLNTAARIAR
jgi:hypothetical protein